MLIKEIRELSKNYVYWIVMLLPLLLTFVMSEGTKNYISQFANMGTAASSSEPVSIYTGPRLSSASQFAVSELSFMVLMTSDLIALSIFRERDLHIWDRVPNKTSFILIKLLTHTLFTTFMISINMGLYKLVFNIAIPINSIATLISLSIIATLFGTCVGISTKTKSTLSGIVLMSVMTMGYFGGALSLTSVLANTQYMNKLMYLSPLTLTNQIIYKSMLGLDITYNLYLWAGIACILAGVMSLIIIRRIKHGTVL